VNYATLFCKLSARDVSGVILRLLIRWYAGQFCSILWAGVISSVFFITNGVRQGGVLSPLLFNLYIHELSSALNCIVGSGSGISEDACDYKSDNNGVAIKQNPRGMKLRSSALPPRLPRAQKLSSPSTSATNARTTLKKCHTALTPKLSVYTYQ